MYRYLVIFLSGTFLISDASVVVPSEDGRIVDESTPSYTGDLEIEVLKERLREMQKWREHMSNEVEALRKAYLNNDGQHDMNRRSDRTRRHAQLPDQSPDCTPGTVGCPLYVTPYSTAASSCILCPAGTSGPPGPAGSPGRDARDAIAIVTSPVEQDKQCPSGDSPIVNASSGAVYVRWGHHDCPPTSEIVYQGTAASSNHLTTGGGLDHLCLTNEPLYDSPISGVGTSRAFIYALEYQIYEMENKIWHDVPCAVCKAPSRVSKLMIPGRNQCPSSEWTLEYGGYLMAERTHTAHHKSLHICVDREMQVVPRSSGRLSSNAEAFINFVEARCSSSGGGIPCGPYVDGYEITCAVCTQ